MFKIGVSKIIIIILFFCELYIHQVWETVLFRFNNLN